MNKHFSLLLSYLIGCFCILQLSANASQLNYLLCGNNCVPFQSVSLPSSKSHHQTPFNLGIAMEVTEEEEKGTKTSQLDYKPDCFFESSVIESNLATSVKTCIKLFRSDAINSNFIPLYVLFKRFRNDLG